MPAQTVFSTTDGHRLFSLRFDSGRTGESPEAATKALETQATKAHVRDGLMLDIRLETCFHGNLSDAGDFGSLLVFQLVPAAEIGDATPLSSHLTISLDFHRDIPHENDVVEVVMVGQDRSLNSQILGNNSSMSWSIQSINQTSRFGVLIKRSFDDLFCGIFRLKLKANSARFLRSPFSSGRKDDTESVLFDPSAKAIGDDIDPENLHAAAIKILASLGAPSQIDGAESTNDLSAMKFGSSEWQDDNSIRPELTSPSSNSNSDQARIKHMTMYHHKQRHVHKPPHTTKSPYPAHAHEMHPLHTSSEDEENWPDPVRYITTHEMGFHMCGLHITRSGVRCIRSIKMKLTQKNDAGEIEEYEAAGHYSMFGMLIHRKRYHDELKDGGRDRYMVVGRMSSNGYVIVEKIFRYQENDEEQMMRKLHSAIRSIRGMRDYLSLKSVSGFSLYQCDPSAGHHTRAHLTSAQRATLRSFYNSYNWRSHGTSEFLWDDWIFTHLNASSCNPEHGKYSIEILLSWSVLRLSIVTSIPVILSLSVGLWYQTLPRTDGSDPTGTAWIIATYIITAGALIIAFLGVATGLEQS